MPLEFNESILLNFEGVNFNRFNLETLINFGYHAIRVEDA